MKKYKELIYSRIRVFGMLTTVIAFLWAFNIFDILQPAGDKNMSGIIEISQIILLSSLALFLTYKMVFYFTLCNDEKRLKDFYIKEHDERSINIDNMAGGHTILFSIVMMIIIGVILSYFYASVFWILMGCAVVLFLTKIFFKLYYRKKY